MTSYEIITICQRILDSLISLGSLIVASIALIIAIYKIRK